MYYYWRPGVQHLISIFLAALTAMAYKANRRGWNAHLEKRKGYKETIGVARQSLSELAHKHCQCSVIKSLHLLVWILP